MFEQIIETLKTMIIWSGDLGILLGVLWFLKKIENEMFWRWYKRAIVFLVIGGWIISGYYCLVMGISLKELGM